MINTEALRMTALQADAERQISQLGLRLIDTQQSIATLTAERDEALSKYRKLLINHEIYVVATKDVRAERDAAIRESEELRDRLTAAIRALEHFE